MRDETGPAPDETGPAPDDHGVAAAVAARAGGLLLGLRARASEVEDLRAVGDRRSNELILSELRRLRPADPVLSEESPDHPGRLSAERVWVVDPLDGTREYGEPPRTDWAVHVALVTHGRPVAGAVCLPALGLTLATPSPPTPPGRPGGGPRLVVSRSRPPEHAVALAAHLGGVLVPMGSAGAKAMAVIRGEADIYAHTGGQYEWDSAAPVAVAAAAGLHVSRIDGSPLRYNRRDPWLPDLLVCRPELAGAVIGFFRDAPG